MVSTVPHLILVSVRDLEGTVLYLKLKFIVCADVEM